jgi:hypothetical protein
MAPISEYDGLHSSVYGSDCFVLNVVLLLGESELSP